MSFAAIDLTSLHEVLHYPIVIDGRNMFSPAAMAEHGFIYTSVGRPDVTHECRRHSQRRSRESR